MIISFCFIASYFAHTQIPEHRKTITVTRKQKAKEKCVCKQNWRTKSVEQAKNGNNIFKKKTNRKRQNPGKKNSNYYRSGKCVQSSVCDQKLHFTKDKYLLFVVKFDWKTPRIQHMPANFSLVFNEWVWCNVNIVVWHINVSNPKISAR